MKSSFWFEYVEGRIEPNAIRELSKLNDETLKFVMASWICNIAGGIELPTKVPKTVLAQRLIEKGRTKEQVMSLTSISERHYFRLKAKNREK